MMHYDIEQINHLIRHRRSVFPRQFESGKQIPDRIIEEILFNATWAPTHKQTEPWSFRVFTGDGLQKLADFQSELYKKEAGEKFKQDKYEQLRTRPMETSHIISLGMKRHPVVPEVEEIASVACAVQNIYLSVTAYGLGGYWTTGGVTYFPSAKSFFGLGDEDRLMGFFYLGYVAVPSGVAKRKGLEEKVVWVRE